MGSVTRSHNFSKLLVDIPIAHVAIRSLKYVGSWKVSLSYAMFINSRRSWVEMRLQGGANILSVRKTNMHLKMPSKSSCGNKRGKDRSDMKITAASMTERPGTSSSSFRQFLFSSMALIGEVEVEAMSILKYTWCFVIIDPPTPPSSWQIIVGKETWADGHFHDPRKWRIQAAFNALGSWGRISSPWCTYENVVPKNTEVIIPHVTGDRYFWSSRAARNAKIKSSSELKASCFWPSSFLLCLRAFIAGVKKISSDRK